MRQSELFTRTRREAPKDEVAKNAQLLIRAGYIHKEMAGAYALLPLGLRVVDNIKKIVREEMNAIGGQEIVMTALQRKELWETTDRWSDENVDIWFKSTLKAGGDIGFGWSHEEPIADMMKNYISSFRDLPMYVYQFQTKLRNELRAKSGIMRGREFVMKDMYSFALNEEEHTRFYNTVKEAYMRVFNRIGIGADTYITFASGGAFTQFSHEFQTATTAGEDSVYINRKRGIAINEEVYNDDTLKSLDITSDKLEKITTAEVGNIFNFGTAKSEKLGLYYTDESGTQIPVWMGSYGIGITRLVGVIVEKFSDDKGIIWPENIAPFQYHLVGLDLDDETVQEEAERLYSDMTNRGFEVLFDDRPCRAGEKFADADLIGIPNRLVVSKKTVGAGQIEMTHRANGTTKMLNEQDLFVD